MSLLIRQCLCVYVLFFALLSGSNLYAASDPPAGIRSPFGSVADLDRPLALRVNPANLSMMPSWGVQFVQSGIQGPWNFALKDLKGLPTSKGDGTGLFIGFRPSKLLERILGVRLGTGIGFQWLYPSDDAAMLNWGPSKSGVGQQHFGRVSNHLRLTYGLSARFKKWFSAGMNFHLLLSDQKEVQGFRTLDFGLLVRPTNYLSAGLMIRNLLSSEYDNRLVPRTWELGLALRPGLTDRLFTSIDIQYTESSKRFGFKYRLGLEPLSGLVLGVSIEHGVPYEGITVSSFLSLRFGHWTLTGGALVDAGLRQRDSTKFRGTIAQVSYEHAEERSLVRWGGQMPLIDIGGKLSERNRSFSLRAGEPVFLRLLMALDKIGRDRSVSAVLVRIGGLRCGLAKVQEVRAALLRLKKKKKKIVVYMTSSSMKSYYLASVADKIFLHPAGTVWLKGLAINHMFYAKALKQIGVKAQFVKIGKYKNAPNQYTHNELTPAHKEASGVLLDDLFSQLISDLVASRKQTKQVIKSWFKHGLHTSSEAKKKKLVDDVFYWGEIESKIRTHMKRGYSFQPSYLRRVFRKDRWHGRSQIAVIHVDGTIVSGPSLDDPLFGMHLSGSSTIIKALEKARFDPRILAVVLRVNSPGGEVLASDLIWRYVDLLNRRKPVVVSMGDVAASGGYYISAPAREIIASRATVTGSIGIFAGKFDFSGLLKMIGVRNQIQKRGETADLFSAYRPFSEQQRKRLQAYIRNGYQSFLKKVSAGRKMKRSAIHKVAQGRIWSGARAHKLGLVDSLGGVWFAIQRAKTLANLPASAEIDILSLPSEPSWSLGGLRLPSFSTDTASKMLLATIQRWKQIWSRLNSTSLWAFYPHAVSSD